ncbi:MAG: outer membrane beta-barrel protein, partial [Alphaproteobacteria bacterium]|nr:outer membrane beta-barrel protein [Alphaproteobacteria bacterium]
MKSFARNALLGACAIAAGCFAGGGAQADALATPSMSGPLAANANPFSIDLPDWFGDAGGKVYVGGAVTGLAYAQSNATHGAPGDADTYIDLSNGQVFIQKTDGWLQFYVQAGEYSLPTVGVPYMKSSTATTANFGVVPVAYLKLQGEDDWSELSLQGGKLPTLIGNEYTFTFENMNIERGLLWNIEPAVSTGIQGNWTHGPLTVSLSWNDGTYAKKWNWLSGLISYA